MRRHSDDELSQPSIYGTTKLAHGTPRNAFIVETGVHRHHQLFDVFRARRTTTLIPTIIERLKITTGYTRQPVDVHNYIYVTTSLTLLRLAHAAQRHSTSSATSDARSGSNGSAHRRHDRPTASVRSSRSTRIRPAPQRQTPFLQRLLARPRSPRVVHTHKLDRPAATLESQGRLPHRYSHRSTATSVWSKYAHRSPPMTRHLHHLHRRMQALQPLTARSASIPQDPRSATATALRRCSARPERPRTGL